MSHGPFPFGGTSGIHGPPPECQGRSPGCRCKEPRLRAQQFPARLRRTPSDETSSVTGSRAILKRRSNGVSCQRGNASSLASRKARLEAFPASQEKALLWRPGTGLSLLCTVPPPAPRTGRDSRDAGPASCIRRSGGVASQATSSRPGDTGHPQPRPVRNPTRGPCATLGHREAFTSWHRPM